MLRRGTARRRWTTHESDGLFFGSNGQGSRIDIGDAERRRLLGICGRTAEPLERHLNRKRRLRKTLRQSVVDGSDEHGSDEHGSDELMASTLRGGL